MLNGYEVNEDTCKFAIAGGNNEIIHICEQQGLKFEECLSVAVDFHRFEIFDRLDFLFIYDEIQLPTWIYYFNELIL